MDQIMAQFNEYYVDVILKKYLLFTGRARRKEFWMFVLFNLVVSIVLNIVVGILANVPGIGFILAFIPLVYSLAILLPSIGLGIRRLHDTDRSGWWLLIGLIPLVGAIVLIVFAAQEGTKGNNQFGPDPKA